jgi:hypothetical protein
MHSHNRNLGVMPRLAVASLLLLAALAAGVSIANAAEIIPAAGMTRSVSGEETEPFGSLSIRGQLAPLLATELGVAYRSETLSGDIGEVRTWPLTASLWLTPVPALYAGGGVGWYNMSFDFDDNLSPPLESHTEQEFGLHLGGGVRVPFNEKAALDLNGRYVMMREQEDDPLVPEQFDPDFWSMALGLAIKF